MILLHPQQRLHIEQYLIDLFELHALAERNTSQPHNLWKIILFDVLIAPDFVDDLVEDVFSDVFFGLQLWRQLKALLLIEFTTLQDTFVVTLEVDSGHTL